MIAESNEVLGTGKASFRGWPVLIALAVLYAPTYFDLWRTLWQSDEYSHAPLVALIVLWLSWLRRAALFGERSPTTADMTWGAAALAFGLATQVIGRSQSIPLFEMVSQIPVLAGLLLLLRGRNALHAAWFPLFFLVFMIPVPGIWIDALTSHLKSWISQISEELLYSAGLPIARNGVAITIGTYQLMVADACSGLYSMFSLTALGVLFIHLTGRDNWLHRLILVLGILPIAFLANLFRVMALILVTYYGGESAGRQLHDFSSPAVFVLATLLLVLFDRSLDRFLPGRK
jgi:exosortase B